MIYLQILETKEPHGGGSFVKSIYEKLLFEQLASIHLAKLIYCMDEIKTGG